ncbi:MAG: hypothetical protein AAB214_07075, partial [Fibrobacterota bacterium]
ATAGGANWICLWGVADNTNLYWRKGQSALIFDEAYNAKGSYYRFRQGIVDGLATVSVGEKPARNAGGIVVGKDGRLRVPGMGDGEVELLDLRGKVRANLDIRGGVGNLPSLPQGIYVIRSIQSQSIRGWAQFLP